MWPQTHPYLQLGTFSPYATFLSPKKFVAGTVIALCTALVLTSCSGSADSDDADDNAGRIPQADIDRLENSFAEANDLAVQLDLVTRRLVRQCMEDDGFTVHPESLDPDMDYSIRAMPGSAVPEREYLPDTDQAETDGLGVHEDWLNVTSDDFEDPQAPDPEFMGMGTEYTDSYFHAMHEMDPVDHSELTPEELKDLMEDDSEPQYGGCVAVANNQIYGSDEDVLSDISGSDIGMDGLPPIPGGLDLKPWYVEFETTELLEAHDNWNSCLEERGAPTVNRLVGLDAYVRSFYGEPEDDTRPWTIGDPVNPEYIEPPD